MSKMNNMEGKYPFITYNIQDELMKIKEDETLVCELFGYKNTNPSTITICTEVYDACISAYSKTVNDMLNENVGNLMVTRSISQGEALWLVEDKFEKEVGFMTLFFRCFFIMVPFCRSTVNQKLEKE